MGCTNSKVYDIGEPNTKEEPKTATTEEVDENSETKLETKNARIVTDLEKALNSHLSIYQYVHQDTVSIR